TAASCGRQTVIVRACLEKPLPGASRSSSRITPARKPGSFRSLDRIRRFFSTLNLKIHYSPPARTRCTASNPHHTKSFMNDNPTRHTPAQNTEAHASDLLTDIRMDTLGLPNTLLQGLSDQGFTHATPIQAETLPRALSGQDIAGQAHTGTGKTIAFLLAIMYRLLSRDPAPSEHAPQAASQPRALIVAPTRELSDQIHRDARRLSTHTELKTVVCYGGTGYDSQREAIANGVDILIGTPGRLIDYYKQKVYTLKAIEVAVLDEADRMFDLGFISDIRYLFRKMPQPHKRQNMLFSATLSHRVLELAYEHMNSPELIRTDTDTVDMDAIAQKLYHVSVDDKPGLL